MSKEYPEKVSKFILRCFPDLYHPQKPYSVWFHVKHALYRDPFSFTFCVQTWIYESIQYIFHVSTATFVDQI